MNKCNLVEPCIKLVMNQRLKEYNNILVHDNYVSFNTKMIIFLTMCIGLFLYVTRISKPSPEDMIKANIEKYTYVQDKVKYLSNRKETWNNHPELMTLSNSKI